MNTNGKKINGEILVNGKTYVSLKEAAGDMDITPTTLRASILTNQLKDRDSFLCKGHEVSVPKVHELEYVEVAGRALESTVHILWELFKIKYSHKQIRQALKDINYIPTIRDLRLTCSDHNTESKVAYVEDLRDLMYQLRVYPHPHTHNYFIDEARGFLAIREVTMITGFEERSFRSKIANCEMDDRGFEHDSRFVECRPISMRAMHESAVKCYYSEDGAPEMEAPEEVEFPTKIEVVSNGFVIEDSDRDRIIEELYQFLKLDMSRQDITKYLETLQPELSMYFITSLVRKNAIRYIALADPISVVEELRGLKAIMG